MKKKARIFLGVFVIGLCLFMGAVPVYNDRVSEEIVNELLQVRVPDHTEVIETVSKSGKLVGNGNGMQYFGAVLIQSDLSMEELELHYSKYRKNEWDCLIAPQSEDKIQMIEHADLYFKTKITSDNYFILYTWGNNDTIFDKVDLRGN